MPAKPINELSKLNGRHLSDRNARTATFSYFMLTVLGFSFWFFMAVPFASHRETYWWLAMVHSQHLSYAFSFISSSYRPLAQAAVWINFLILDPSVFPTSVLRQALLQLLTYGMFILAWWLIYSAATQRRLFALTACVAGGVFFSGYVHLFHVYGIVYVPPLLTLGALLRFHASGTLKKHEVWFAGVTTLFVLWHPFTTALFVGFYFGYYLDTFSQRSRAQHYLAGVILLVGMTAIAAFLVALPRFLPGASALFVQTATRSLDTRLFGFLLSYQTNEVNWIASLVAFLLTQMVFFSMKLSPRLKFAAVLLVSALGVFCLLKNLPLLLLWLCAVLVKLCWLRCWSLFFLALTAVLFPFGGGIGGPTYALFAIIIAAYVTPMGWAQAEKLLSFVKTRYVIGTIMAAGGVVLMVRAGIELPIVTPIARPLLVERERTYQLESILAWLRASAYCADEIAYIEDAGSPIDSIESVISRRNRPPAALEDVQRFWKTVLKCQKADRPENKAEIATVTFGETVLADSRPVFKIGGRYAGDATVWIRDFEK